jgi:hypothetical protein
MAKAASLLFSIAVISAALASFGQSAPNPKEGGLPKGWAEAPSSKLTPVSGSVPRTV